MTDGKKSPVLQKYFENDPPSFFDQIKENQDTVVDPLSLNDSLPFESFDNVMGTEQFPVTDEVRNMWNFMLAKDSLELTIPTISIVNDMPDPIQQAVIINCPDESSKRKVLTADDVTQDAIGIRKLIEEGCLRSAINLTKRLLNMYGFDGKSQIGKHTPHSLQVWFTRLSLLLKIGEYEACRIEAEPFEQLNKVDLFHEYRDPQAFKSKKGSTACFSFRVLLAVLPMYYSKPKAALRNLVNLLETTKKIRVFFENQEKVTECEFWRQREILVMHQLINCSLTLKNYDLVHQIFAEILQNPNLTDDDKFLYHSAWGRIYLQTGNILDADRMFSSSRKFQSGTKFSRNELIDRGLLSIAQNDYQKGFATFQKALSAEDSVKDPLILNNMAVCCLYSGKLDEAIKIYENAIATKPKKTINEHILLNLSTLYELQSSESKTKKIEILKKINEHRADLYTNLDSCLKL